MLIEYGINCFTAEDVGLLINRMDRNKDGKIDF
jgi:hypothetical protein